MLEKIAKPVAVGLSMLTGFVCTIFLFGAAFAAPISHWGELLLFTVAGTVVAGACGYFNPLFAYRFFLAIGTLMFILCGGIWAKQMLDEVPGSIPVGAFGSIVSLSFLASSLLFRIAATSDMRKGESEP